MIVSSGSEMISATSRGKISTPTGFRPMTVSASISSRIFMEPTSAVIALPERPAIMMAVSKTPISRNCRMPTRSTTKISAPKYRSWNAPCWAMIAPMRKLMSRMIGTAPTPMRSI